MMNRLLLDVNSRQIWILLVVRSMYFLFFIKKKKKKVKVISNPFKFWSDIKVFKRRIKRKALSRTDDKMWREKKARAGCSHSANKWKLHSLIKLNLCSKQDTEEK